MAIHPTAVVHPSLDLPSDLEVGPYAVLDEDVVVGTGVRIGPFCRLHAGVRLEDGVALSEGVILGGKPQDIKYRGEKTWVRIGAGTELREFVTVNRGTKASEWTLVGRRCLIMAYSHVAHDCALGDQVIIANGVQMGGHVSIGEGSVISGMTGIHQFTTIGPGCFIGGGLRVDKDILPFTKAMGEPLRWAGLNPMGLARLGLDDAEGSAAAHLADRYRSLVGEGKPALLATLSGAGGQTRHSGNGHGRAADVDSILREYFSRHSRSLLVRSSA